MRIVIINKNISHLLLPIIIAVLFLIVTTSCSPIDKSPLEFNGQRAYSDVKYQVGLGPRTMGSVAHEQTVNWITSELQSQNWQVEIQETVISGRAIKNVIAKRGTGIPWIILGSHYDSRSIADKDPDIDKRKQPVLGANDGASSVAVLIELARILPININKQIWLVFFDDEDNGDNSGTGWIVGSNYFVSQLSGKPDKVIILDMVGDKDLNIYMEVNSDRELNNEVWGVARQLGYSQFISDYKHELIDDHIPFLQEGIQAIDIVDFDYPYWHTTHDTLDKISADSLEVVGHTILSWLDMYPKK